MENLKVRVNNEAESKEAQGYFENLGAVCCSGLERSKNVNFLFMNSGFVTACKLQENFDKSKCKEITLPELRDLVVLKRNDVGDYTHGSSFGSKFYYCCDGDVYAFNDGTWVFDHTKVLKPIEKTEMKEYLVKSQDGKWCLETDLVGDPADTVIEIPAGAEKYIEVNKRNFAFYRNNFKEVFLGGWEETACNSENLELFNSCSVLWQRNQEPKQAEFLVKTDGGYVLQVLDENSGGADVVHVPDGADIALSGGGSSIYFYNGNDLYFNGSEWRKCNPDSIKTVDAYIATGATVLWKRETPNDQVASAEEYREMISNAASIGLTSVVVDIANSCGGRVRNASPQGKSEFPLNNHELNHRVAKAFNAVRGTDLNEDDVNYIRELIGLTISHYGERK